MGRTKIPLTPEQVEQVESLAGLGLSTVKIGAFLGMSKKTFERRQKDTPGLSDAMDRGRAVRGANVSQAAYDLAVSGKCPGMTQWWMEVMEGHKRTVVNEVTGKDGAPLSFTDWVKDLTKKPKKKGS